MKSKAGTRSGGLEVALEMLKVFVLLVGLVALSFVTGWKLGPWAGLGGALLGVCVWIWFMWIARRRRGFLHGLAAVNGIAILLACLLVWMAHVIRHLRG